MKNPINSIPVLTDDIEVALDILDRNTEAFVKAGNDLFKKVNKLDGRIFWLNVCLIGAGYCIYKLQNALNKSNAQIFALQSQVDALEIEKQVEEG